MKKSSKNEGERRILGLTILQFMSLLAVIGIVVTLAVNYFSTPVVVARYHCKGLDPFENATYEGTLEIKQQGETYVLTSDYGKDAVYQGIGILDAQHNVMAAAFNNPAKPNESGVAMLHIDKTKNTLTAEWTYFNKTLVGSSQCEKV